MTAKEELFSPNGYINVGKSIANTVMQQIKSSGRKYRDKDVSYANIGRLSKDFLDAITSLNIQTSGEEKILQIVDMLPNLQKLTIGQNDTCNYDEICTTGYKAKISDDDLTHIEACTSLKELSIFGQHEITSLDVSQLKNLETLNVSDNHMLDEITGINNATKLDTLNCWNNVSLSNFENLCEFVTRQMKESYLVELRLDPQLFPQAIGYNPANGTYNQETINLMDRDEGNIRWTEKAGNDSVGFPHGRMISAHNKACEILNKIRPRVCNTEESIIYVERYLADNVRYDHDALNSKSFKHSTSSPIEGLRMTEGSKYGTNSMVNGLLFNSAICQVYTRTEKYLLGLCGIKSHEVGCRVGSELHSIICIDGCNNVYSDSCWNAGEKDLPYTGLSQDKISKIRKLFAIETENFANIGYSIPREKIKFYSDIYDNEFGKRKPYIELVKAQKTDGAKDKVVRHTLNKMDMNISR